MIRLFAGFDEREAIGYAVFCHSVVARASQPVSFTPLHAMGLPEGSNCFTVSRFLIPWLCGYTGYAIFMDGSDMLMLGDVSALAMAFDPRYAVQVVKHPDYKTRHRTKYVGTEMECPNRDYPRKNWASVMLINCEHPDWRWATPEALAKADLGSLLSFGFTDAIGDLPAQWNCLLDEGQPLGLVGHWTAGIPAFPAYADAPYAKLWHDERRRMEGVWTSRSS